MDGHTNPSQSKASKSVHHRQEIVTLLRALMPDLRERYGVTSLHLFGSAARNELSPDSDVDLAVSFSGPADARRYFGLKFELEDLLGREVDLATEKMISDRLRKRIEDELISVS